jgi:hypothetical protein
MVHWALYCRLRRLAGTAVVAEGIKFILFDADRLCRQLYGSPPGQRWHVVAARTLSNGWTKRLWVNEFMSHFHVDIDLDLL